MLVGGVMFFPGANYLLGNLDLELRLGAELGNRINFKITSLITVMVYYLINCQNCLRIQIETISYQALVELISDLIIPWKDLLFLSEMNLYLPNLAVYRGNLR